jgi:hypothetical protein
MVYYVQTLFRKGKALCNKYFPLFSRFQYDVMAHHGFVNRCPSTYLHVDPGPSTPVLPDLLHQFFRISYTLSSGQFTPVLPDLLHQFFRTIYTCSKPDISDLLHQFFWTFYTRSSVPSMYTQFSGPSTPVLPDLLYPSFRTFFTHFTPVIPDLLHLIFRTFYILHQFF